MARVSVIVPATDDPPSLERCQASIAEAARPPEQTVIVRGLPNVSPAAARNAGARAADGNVLMFVDSDVLVHPDAFVRVRAAFDADPQLVAVFGSYDDSPEAVGVISGFRNLLHHHVHQCAEGPASTFWTGLGAVRRDAFEAAGGFDGEMSTMEDVELGMRLIARGGRIQLDPLLLGTHLKAWSLRRMVLTDLRYRATPWTLLLIRRRALPNALNLGWSQRVSAISLAVTPMLVLFAGPLAAGASLGLMVTLNYPFYRLLWRRRGLLQMLAGVALHALYYVTAMVGLVAGLTASARKPSRPSLEPLSGQLGTGADPTIGAAWVVSIDEGLASVPRVRLPAC